MSSKLKDLTIKTGVLKRLIKEEASYWKEVEREKRRLEKVRADAEEDLEIRLRKQNEVIEDTRQMIPHVHKRLLKSLQDLEDLVATEDPEYEGSAEIEEARKWIEEGRKAQNMPEFNGV
ncbi:Tubulin-specific chaperone A [Neolecta irregularis DAH-3]|uniref:Tubulin-specific chaperone A n=1 Tax=Neolecta irregularis (strain DAH-3) TaxID=1198029 RepID=A0A1U7LT90_NEOID|nr:Tubulin-specific chaperone A [Neolecta irregularis DAH-3]|eukprot:OLL25864.1 Tubulin-specific chaperone A [Neolecta irregularis DAH-3]